MLMKFADTKLGAIINNRGGLRYQTEKLDDFEVWPNKKKWAEM